MATLPHTRKACCRIGIYALANPYALQFCSHVNLPVVLLKPGPCTSGQKRTQRQDERFFPCACTTSEKKNEYNKYTVASRMQLCLRPPGANSKCSNGCTPARPNCERARTHAHASARAHAWSHVALHTRYARMRLGCVCSYQHTLLEGSARIIHCLSQRAVGAPFSRRGPGTMLRGRGRARSVTRSMALVAPPHPFPL